jgi:hypothetical protein
MIKSSSIYYTVVLAIIIALVLGSMVTLSGLNKLLEQKIRIPQILMQNAESGLAYAEVFHEELTPGVPVELSLFDGPMDSVTVTKKNWGAFVVLVSEAHHHRQYFSKMSLCGQLYSDDEPNFYLVDNGRTLGVAGNTVLEGDCYLPSGGTKRAYIGGKNFTGRTMISGREFKSARKLPPVNQLFFEYLKTPMGTVKSWSELIEENKDSICNSFGDAVWLILGEDFISTEGMTMSGQLWIEADSVFVAANSTIDGIVIKGRSVNVEEGFVGNLQIFAEEKITVGREAVLMYPSVLGMIGAAGNGGISPELNIDSATKVLGTVFLLTENPDFRNLPELTIETDAFVHGLVYCEGKTQLKGTVNGSLYTEKFFLETPASSYENHLLDARVLDRLPEEFVCVDLLRGENDEALPLTRIDFLK